MLPVAETELSLDIRDTDAHLLHQHQKMINEVGTLIDKAVTISVHSLDYALAGLFNDFFTYGLRSLYEKFGGIRPLRHLLMALADHITQFADKALGVRRVKTACGAPVTGGSVRNGLDEQSVTVAILEHLDDVQAIAAGLALGPKAGPGP